MTSILKNGMDWSGTGEKLFRVHCVQQEFTPSRYKMCFLLRVIAESVWELLLQKIYSITSSILSFFLNIWWHIIRLPYFFPLTRSGTEILFCQHRGLAHLSPPLLSSTACSARTVASLATCRDGHLACFQFLMTVNDAALSVHGHASLCTRTRGLLG